MSNGNGGYPSYPVIHGHTVEAIGFTKRELIAAMAMQGFLSSFGGVHNFSISPKNISSQSVLFADALLEALNGKS